MIVIFCFSLPLKFRSTIPDTNNYSEFELLPGEGQYDATSHMNQVFKTKVDPKVVDASANRDANNYCEVELEPNFEQYDTTFCEKKDMMTQETYSELEPSLTLGCNSKDEQISVSYNLGKVNKNGADASASKLQISHECNHKKSQVTTCEEYSDLDMTASIDCYDTTSHKKGKAKKEVKIPASRKQFNPNAYSELELTLSNKEYDITCHGRNRTTLAQHVPPLQLDPYSDMEVSTVGEEYDTTTHKGGKTNKERAKVFADNSATCVPEAYSEIELTLEYNTTSHNSITKKQRDFSASCVVLSKANSYTEFKANDQRTKKPPLPPRLPKSRSHADTLNN